MSKAKDPPKPQRDFQPDVVRREGLRSPRDRSSLKRATTNFPPRECPAMPVLRTEPEPWPAVGSGQFEFRSPFGFLNAHLANNISASNTTMETETISALNLTNRDGVKRTESQGTKRRVLKITNTA